MDEPEHSDEPPPLAGGPKSDELSVEILDPDALMGAAEGAWLRAQGGLVLGAIRRRFGRGGGVRVSVVGDATMSAAHERYTGVTGTTDVLTFDLSETETIDTDIMVCIDEARRRAREHGHAPERELLLYIVHGVLHCLGFDDHDDAGYAAMHAVEDELLEEIGIGATFAPDGHAGRGVSP